ncbi:MAG: primosomal protein N', partial [Clostridia bacterium]|nr:primosomal protein N' [Clostridia bacterium]
YKEAMDGNFQLIKLLRRVENRVMPEMEIVDMCKELREGNQSIISSRLVAALGETLNRKEQAMIFLNRRGFSAFMICRKCGKVLKCEDCEVSLTLHKEDNRLKCHYCGRQYTVPTVCPECGSASIRYGRDGTEKIVSDLKKQFPNARILRMDNDTTRQKASYVNILGSFAKGEADILVGTQMIAKGHDFANVTLVGILDADMSLYYGDYHSVERTFQLVTQVSGRAGRDVLPGRVILQTYSPKHYIFYFASKYDYDGFYNKEINTREVTDFPPFVKIVRVLIAGADEAEVVKCTKTALYKIKETEKEYPLDFRYIKATKSPITRIENKYRYQIFIKLRREREEEIISKIYKAAEESRLEDISIFVELNPQNLS